MYYVYVMEGNVCTVGVKVLGGLGGGVSDAPSLPCSPHSYSSSLSLPSTGAYCTSRLSVVIACSSERFNDWGGRGYDGFVPGEIPKTAPSGDETTWSPTWSARLPQVHRIWPGGWSNMSPVGAIFVPFPPKTGTNMLHPLPPKSLNLSSFACQNHIIYIYCTYVRVLWRG